MLIFDFKLKLPEVGDSWSGQSESALSEMTKRRVGLVHEVGLNAIAIG